MTTKSPASLPPSKVPGASSGTGQYIAIAVVLFIMMGGLLCWKVRGTTDSAPPPVASTPPSASFTARSTIDAPPPPPDDPEPAPSASAGKKTVVGSGGGGFGCGATTCGTPAPAMRGELQARAGNARGCYERALRTNPNLQGRVVVAVRVDSTGSVCSASVAQDSVGGDVAACILPMFRAGKFSAPTGGCADATVPLNFQPKNK